MGYYTYFELAVLKVDGPNPNYSRDVDLRLLTKEETNELDDMIGEVIPLELSEDCWNGYEKWYDYDIDMLEISEQHPDILFTLSGDGEDREDIWIKHYLNGTSQDRYYRPDPFDESFFERALSQINDIQIDGDISSLIGD